MKGEHVVELLIFCFLFSRCMCHAQLSTLSHVQNWVWHMQHSTGWIMDMDTKTNLRLEEYKTIMTKWKPSIPN